MDFDTLDITEGEEALDNPSPWLIGGVVVAAGLAYYLYSSSSAAVATEAVAAKDKPLEKTQDQKEVAAIKKWLRKFRPGSESTGFMKPMYKLNKVESRVIADEDTTYYFGKKAVPARKDKDVVYQLMLDFTPGYLEATKQQAPAQPTEFFVLVTPELKVSGLGSSLRTEAPSVRASGEQVIVRGTRGERASGPGDQYLAPVSNFQSDLQDDLEDVEEDLDEDELELELGLGLRKNRSRSRRNGLLISLPSKEEISTLKIPTVVAGGALVLLGLGAAAYFMNRNR